MGCRTFVALCLVAGTAAFSSNALVSSPLATRTRASPSMRLVPKFSLKEKLSTSKLSLGSSRSVALQSAAGEAVPEPESDVKKIGPLSVNKKLYDTAELGFFFALWYLFNIGYNIYNKQLLNVYPFPWTMACVQLGVGLLYLIPVWGLGIRKAPKCSAENLKNLSPIASMHCIGHLMTVVSLGAGAVSFTHIVKAAEPLFSSAMSAIFLGQFFAWPVYLSLLPVVVGVAIASLSELSFSWVSFLNAMGSNTAFAMRAVFSKKAMGTPQGENMNPANLYGVLTILSFVGLLPFALLVEGSKLGAGFAAAVATGLTPGFILWLMLASGLNYYLYNEMAFLCLGKVSPVTHAVGNTIKRVVIILASVVAFGTKLTPNGIIGSTIAIGGVLLYSLVKAHYDKKEK